MKSFEELGKQLDNATVAERNACDIIDYLRSRGIDPISCLRVRLELPEKIARDGVAYFNEALTQAVREEGDALLEDALAILRGQSEEARRAFGALLNPEPALPPPLNGGKSTAETEGTAGGGSRQKRA